MLQGLGDVIERVYVQTAMKLLDTFSNYQPQKDLLQSVRCLIVAGR